jgi:transposase, IS5 family
MQKVSENKQEQIFFTNENQIIETILEKDHPFRTLKEIINFEEITNPLRKLYSSIGQDGIDIEKGFKALLVQFWEDYSDRQMEKAIRENIAIRWFCGFSLMEETPDHTYFCRLRKRIGTKNIAKIFEKINLTLRSYGLFGNVFKFIDASAIITKTALWEEQDKAIADGKEKLNNAIVNKYSADKEAKWGAKSKKNIWFGYKRHHSTDMRFGMIDKVAVTPANIPDFKAIRHISPSEGMAFLDKGYDYEEARNELENHGCHAGIIRKNNSMAKNFDLDRWLSKVRMPFEGGFSKLRRRAKFRGLTKVSMQCFMEAICQNLKKAVRLIPEMRPC